MGSIYKIITKEKQLDKVIEYCKKTGYASIDFETNAKPFHSELFTATILGISFQPGSSWILPLGHKNTPFKKRVWKRMLRKFGKEVISNPLITKIAWNLKFEYKIFKRYNIIMKGRLFDGMLAKYLLKEDRPSGLKDMVSIFLPEFAGYDLKGVPSFKAKPERQYEFWSNVELDELSKYCGIDCDTTFRLMLHFERLLIKHGFYAIFRNMMMVASKVLGDSEFFGFPINLPYLESLLIIYQEKIKNTDKSLRNNKVIRKFEKDLLEGNINQFISKIEDEIEDLELLISSSNDIKFINRKQKSIESRLSKIDRIYAKDFTTKSELKLIEPVNFASPPQMIKLLYESKKGLKFDILDYTDTGNPSTAEETLLKLKEYDKSGFIDLLLEYRGLTKLYSTYVKGIYDKILEDGKIHGSFLLHGTVTGRLSSRNPNLQNIPRDTTAADIKKMFIPPKGMLLIQLDYSQAELRVIAAAAGETNMIQWFKDGRDIHLAVACDKNKWEYDWALDIYKKEEVGSDEFFLIKTQRKFAKKINFGIIYGQTAKKLSIEMGLSIEEAEIYLREYHKRFPMISKFIKKQHRLVQKYGYVKNLFGRKRRLPNIDSNKWHEKAEAQRQSVNAPIQGAASDYTLFSSILIWEKIQLGELPNTMIQAYTVHDSLGYFIYPKDIHKIIPILDKVCKNPETKEWFGFQIDDVVMKVDFEVSEKNWMELKNYDSNNNYHIAA